MYHHGKKNITVVLILVMSLSVIGGCSSSQKPPQPEMPPPAKLPSINTEPTIIEFDDSKLANALSEGDIPEEDRGELPWLPKRPPRGMRFEKTTELEVVYFEFDKYSLTTQTRNTLNDHALWIKNNPDVFVQIEGHCDERGTLEYNQVLGENRAIAVKKYLVTLGIDPDRLYTISYGETIPSVPGQGEEIWAKNRRAQFKTSR
jgi:peptidoglycan-associated lipoprotein